MQLGKQALNLLSSAVSEFFQFVAGHHVAHAARFHLAGSGGIFPPSTELESPDGTPFDPGIPNTLPTPSEGSRSATASGLVESGIVRLTAETAVTADTHSIGTTTSRIRATWEDTLITG